MMTENTRAAMENIRSGVSIIQASIPPHFYQRKCGGIARACILVRLWYHAVHMAKACPITNKTSQVGGSYSNRTRATQFNPCGKRRRYPNLQKKKIFVPELGATVTMEVST